MGSGSHPVCCCQIRSLKQLRALYQNPDQRRVSWAEIFFAEIWATDPPLGESLWGCDPACRCLLWYLQQISALAQKAGQMPGAEQKSV